MTKGTLEKRCLADNVVYTDVWRGQRTSMEPSIYRMSIWLVIIKN